MGTVNSLLVASVFTNTRLPRTEIPSRTPPEGPNPPLPAHTSSFVAPLGRWSISMLAVSETYAVPSGPTAMSLQNAPSVGSWYFALKAPVRRLKVLRVALAELCCPGMGEKQAYSVFDLLSAKTPKLPSIASLSGLIHGSAVAAPGFTEKIVRALMLPIMILSSLVEVRLSG